MKVPLSAALLLALAAGAPPAASADDLVTVRNEAKTVEFQVPPGFKEQPPVFPTRIKLLQYDSGTYASAVVQVFGFEGQSVLPGFMTFVEQNTGKGTCEYLGDSKVRFMKEFMAPGATGTEVPWITYVEGRCQGKWGYYIECKVKKEIFDAQRELWDRVIDSFKTSDPPPDAYEVPAAWKVIKTDFYAVLGPVNEIKDRKARDQLERGLARISTWLDPISPTLKMFRDYTGDTRKYPERCVVHVLPTKEAFQAEAGDRYVEGAAVLYLPDSKDRVLVVDASPDAVLQEVDVAAEAGVQYMETRLGKMWPWLRVAFRQYFEFGFQSRCTPGVFPEEAKKRAKEVFAKGAIPFEELMRKDAAGAAALDADGRLACWGVLQYGLHGPDAAFRDLFRKLVKDAIAGGDLQKAWDGAVVAYKEDAKKAFKPNNLDQGVKKFFKEMKEEKK